MGKYKHKLDTIQFKNRWKTKRFLRPSSWCLIGIHTFFHSVNSYYWAISLFGIDLIFWFEREWIEK